MNHIRTLFFGTPDYVMPVVKNLAKKFTVCAIVTQRPKPVGKKKIVTKSPIENWARKNKVQVLYESAEIVRKKIKTDVGVLASFGKILPKSVINYFPHGILNIHPSLLPKFRGPSPVQATLVTGENAGSTIIKLDEKIDTGPILAQFEEKVGENDTAETLRNRLFVKSAKVLGQILPDYIDGKIKFRKQNDKKATYTTLIKKSDAFIPPEYLNATLQSQALKGKWKIPFIKNCMLPITSYLLHNFIRAMQPWPAAWTYVQLEHKTKNKAQKRLKILKSHLKNDKLVLDQVQLEGKNPVSWEQFKKGYPKAKFENIKG